VQIPHFYHTHPGSGSSDVPTSSSFMRRLAASSTAIIKAHERH
jgi:hypothetical protein